MDADGTLENTSDDPWFHFVYHDQWRPPPPIVATYRGSDGSPKEQFVYHHAGRAGPGGGESSSYIDAVVLRDRDMTNGWAGAADGTLEERTYYCQNWRADVVALVTSGGAQIQQTRYGEYGEAYGLPQGDTDGDGDVNSGDTVDSDQIQTWINGSAYDVRGDLDLDGDVDSTDKTAAIAMAGTVLGWGNMSLGIGASAGGNRKGYAGYENDGVLSGSQVHHVRHRVYHSGLGRWQQRDPLGYVDNSLYAYCDSKPLLATDPNGTLPSWIVPCLVGGGFGAIGSLFADWWDVWINNLQFDWRRFLCRGGVGAIKGCCTSTACLNSPAHCIPAACACGVIGMVLEDMCQGDPMWNTADPCFFRKVTLAMVDSCGAGVLQYLPGLNQIIGDIFGLAWGINMDVMAAICPPAYGIGGPSPAPPDAWRPCRDPQSAVCH